MKKSLIIVLAHLLIITSIYAQAPQKMSYQAVIRNSSNALVTNQAVGMRISILQGTASGSAVYVETQTPTTNANGLASIEIGGGTVVSGNFSTIDWAKGPFFIKTETDPAGGTSYTITGTSQLLSVPYVLYSKTTSSSVSASGDTLYIGNTPYVIPGIRVANTRIGTYSPGTVHCTGTPTAVVDVTNPVTGKTWMDRNLGASRAATSSNDANSYGDLYQWGRRADGHQCRTSSKIATLSSTDQPTHGSFILTTVTPEDWRIPQNNNLWQGVNGVNNPCPSGYRLPTRAELDTERSSWSGNNAAGAIASPLKFPMAGFRFGSNGSLFYVGSNAYYWSGTAINSSTYFNAYCLSIDSNGAGFLISTRAFGYSVRCLKD